LFKNSFKRSGCGAIQAKTTVESEQ